ncbi:MAG: hypothetical protein LBG81_07760 [Coriobacteriaceae bacterium]|jgi:alginate O-acetyltransferase complex protein AlgI|nr:hypothetical protein [Coriobacteriaceae bacterium]
MVFSSLSFICVFLPLVFGAYALVPSLKAKNGILIVVSLVFYAYGEPVYVLLMLASSLMNYAFGRLIARYSDKASKHRPLASAGGGLAVPPTTGQPSSNVMPKLLLVASVVANLAFLGVFKYAGMFVETVDALLGQSWEVPLIALPIGISFYTFQAMSYVVDVYRKQVDASHSYPRVLLYISFFPQLIAGPIIKYHDVETQLVSRALSVEGVALGLRRFTVGLAKKVLVANTMAVVVDNIYSADLSQVNILVAWVAALAYCLQIYFDFSGYSDMAIGLARIFGFRYKENFDYPYVSASIKEFWRRWHISLSTWFKEYLYIPLGGSRKGRARTAFNKLVVFFCCGLWHGATWTFVLWGLFHGLFLMLEEFLPIKRLPKALGVLYALLVVAVGFVLFRADTISQAGYLIAQMFTGFHFEAATTAFALRQLTPLFLVVFAAAVLACLPVRAWIARLVERRVARLRGFLSLGSFVLSFLALVLCIAVLSGGGYNPFIYFRF